MRPLYLTVEKGNSFCIFSQTKHHFYLASNYNHNKDIYIPEYQERVACKSCQCQRRYGPKHLSLLQLVFELPAGFSGVTNLFS